MTGHSRECSECFDVGRWQCVACGWWLCSDHKVLVPGLAGKTADVYCPACGPEVERRRAEGTKLLTDLAALVQATLPAVEPAPALRSITMHPADYAAIEREAVAATGKSLVGLDVTAHQREHMAEGQALLHYADDSGALVDLRTGEVLTKLEPRPTAARWEP